MTTEKLQTAFGGINYTYAEDIREFEATSQNCKIIAINGDNDGPYWQDKSHDWARLNELCHDVCRDDMYSVASRDIQPRVIDSTESVGDDNWSAWVTNNPSELFEKVRQEVIDELEYTARTQSYTTEEEVTRQMIVDIAKSAFFAMMGDDGLSVDDAIETAANNIGLELAY